METKPNVVPPGELAAVDSRIRNWTGQISDSFCGAVHQRTEPESDKPLSARACTLASVEDGATFVLVSGGKVYQIANQDNPGLRTHAGETVILSGKLIGDAVTVSYISRATE